MPRIDVLLRELFRFPSLIYAHMTLLNSISKKQANKHEQNQIPTKRTNITYITQNKALFSLKTAA